MGYIFSIFHLNTFTWRLSLGLCILFICTHFIPYYYGIDKSTDTPINTLNWVVHYKLPVGLLSPCTLECHIMTLGKLREAGALI